MPLPNPKKGTTVPKSGTLWMLSMPGLTGDVLLSVAEELKLLIHGQMVNLSKEQWIQFRKRCEEKLGLPSNWDEKAYREARDWFIRDGWGTKYGPGTGGGYKRKGKKERGGDVDVKIKQNKQRSTEQKELW